MKTIRHIALALALLLLLTASCASAATFITEDSGSYHGRTGNSGGALTTSLEFKQGKFYGGQKLAVYTGPGTEYFRTGGGYAKVNTDKPLYVAGQEGTWALVMDELSSGGSFRVGYIDLSQLKYNISFKQLNFAYASKTITKNCAMTNIPVGAGDDIVAFAAGEKVTYLCDFTAHQAWAYVETVIDRVPVRGFIPAGCLE